MFIASDEKRHLYEALTQHNYFPNQKEGVRELPSCFSTKSFTPEIVELLVKLPELKEQGRRKLGYDQVMYSVTRHNNVPRPLALIHPKAYSFLVKTIHDNWDEIKHISENEHSMIKPYHHVDGRIIVMNYENIADKMQRSLRDGFAKRFRAHTDISSCFHSIYSHAIPWAVIGFEKAKRRMIDGGKKHWSDELDVFQRKSRRNETQGVAIGPGTSSIVVELILSSVDKSLDDSGFTFKRYIDDYTCLCETYEESQRFIQRLGKELSRYKLNINLHKTNIVELPEPADSDWVTELMGSLPSGFIDAVSNQKKLDLVEVLHFIDTAVRINKITPDGSVIKYGVSSILRYVNSSTVQGVLDYVINLAWHYPILIPFLEILLGDENVDVNEYIDKLNLILLENAKNQRSDGMAWVLYFIYKYDLTVSKESSDEVLKSKDCLSLLCLYKANNEDKRVIDFANDLLKKSYYEMDEYWILLYQLYKEDQISEPYGDGVFELLKENDVNFMPEEGHYNIAQRYCDYVNNPFLEESEKLLSFEKWKESLN